MYFLLVVCYMLLFNNKLCTFLQLEPDCERFKVVSIPDQWNTVTKTIQHSVAASEGGMLFLITANLLMPKIHVYIDC